MPTAVEDVLELSQPARTCCRYGDVTPWMYFHTRTAVLNTIIRRTGSQWRLRRTGVMRSPDVVLQTLGRAAVYCNDYSRFIECQLFLVCVLRYCWMLVVIDNLSYVKRRKTKPSDT